MDPVHQDIKLIIAEKYQRHPSHKSLDTEMDLMLVEFVSALSCLVDDTYNSLLSGGNFNEYVWWINTRVIRSMSEDYLDIDRANPTCTYFGSDPHRRSTLL